VSDVLASTLAAADKRRFLEDALRRLPQKGAESVAARIGDEILDLTSARRVVEAEEDIAPDLMKRHNDAVEDIRGLDTRATVRATDGTVYRVYGTTEQGAFVPKFAVADDAAREGGIAGVAEAIYEDARRAPDIREASLERVRKLVAEGELSPTSPFASSAYANKADLANNPKGGLRQMKPVKVGQTPPPSSTRARTSSAETSSTPATWTTSWRG